MINFPSSPTEGQEETLGGKDWIYTGGKWILASLVISSGTYTPTPTGILNVASAVGKTTNWVRQENYITVSGKVTVTPTAGATITAVDITLPVASNFTTNDDVSGASTVNQGTSYITGGFVGSAAGVPDNIRIVFISNAVANHDVRFVAVCPILP